MKSCGPLPGRGFRVYPLDYDAMDGPVLDAENRMFYRYNDPLNGQIEFQPTDILHFKWQSLDGVAGIEMASVGVRTVLQAMYVQEFANDFSETAPPRAASWSRRKNRTPTRSCSFKI